MAKVCIVCGKEFTSTANSRKCCSEECSTINNKLRDKERNRRRYPKLKKICPICGAEFETVYRRQNTCSAECAYKRKLIEQHEKWRRTHPKACQEKICPACGKTFIPSDRRQIYYSKECYHENKLQYHSVQKACPVCGELFLATDVHQIYCSKKCYQKHRNSRRTNPLQVKECINCGAAFVTSNRGKRFCSAACGTKYWKKIHRKPKLNRAKKSAPIKLKPSVKPAQDVFKLSKKQVEQRDRLKEKLLQRRADFASQAEKFDIPFDFIDEFFYAGDLNDGL